MKTSWQNVHKWYNDKVGNEGHDYHQEVIFPNLLPKLTDESMVDFACGQGVLGRKLGPKVKYTGFDIAPSFIQLAKKSDPAPKHQYFTHDCTLPVKGTETFQQAACILAAQNIENLAGLAANAKTSLNAGGKFHLVLNHPCFRIPRQSSWGEDKEKKIQYRRLDLYMSALKIPIQTHPAKGEKSPETWSFHNSLTDFMKPFFEAGFMLSGFEEWISHKESQGGKARMENRAREEFPLFLYLQFTKNSI